VSALVQLVGVSKNYDGAAALHPIDLSFERGETTALIGPSGCGKSTILRLINGLLQPTAGIIEFEGRPVQPANILELRRRMGYVIQDGGLFPHLTARENIVLMARHLGRSDGEIQGRVEELCKLSRFPVQALERYPVELSGGQRQRVSLMRALMLKPDVLLLDEPLGALDKKLREETQIELVNIIEQVGVTCVMVTHDQEEAMTMASRIAVMSEGRILQVGAPAEIYETPANRFVADFIGNVNLMDGLLVEDQPDHCIIECRDCRQHVGHGITGTRGMAVSVAIRPEKIALSRSAPADTVHNAVQGTVKEMSYFGSFTVYHLALASGALLKVSAANTQRHREDPLAWGDTAWASWSPSAHVVLTH
jgi:putrescine transport system ATP-binding protein